MSWIDLESYKVKRSRARGMFVSLGSGRMIFSKDFVEQIINKEAMNICVILFYSRINKAIVLKFIDHKNTTALKLSRRGANITIPLASFFREFDIEQKLRTGRHIPKLEQIPGIGERWVVYLDEGK